MTVANPQLENGHLRIASEIVRQLARLNLSPYEWRVLWAVWLKTWGWRKKADSVPVSQIVEMTGLRQPHVSRAKTSLLKKRILFEQDGKLSFQKDYEVWAVKGFTYTDSGIKSDEKYTDSGTTHTYTGMKSIPIQVLSTATTTTSQQLQRAQAAKSFREHWNTKPNLPRIRRMTTDRGKKLAARMKEPDFRDNWRQIIDRMAASSFCTGGGKKGWKADVDWLLGNSTNYVKVLEGKYDDAPAVKPVERRPDGLTPREYELKRIGAA